MDDAHDSLEGYCALCGGFTEGWYDYDNDVWVSSCCDADMLDDHPKGYDENGLDILPKL